MRADLIWMTYCMKHMSSLVQMCIFWWLPRAPTDQGPIWPEPCYLTSIDKYPTMAFINQDSIDINGGVSKSLQSKKWVCRDFNSLLAVGNMSDAIWIDSLQGFWSPSPLTIKIYLYPFPTLHGYRTTASQGISSLLKTVFVMNINGNDTFPFPHWYYIF